MPKVFIEFYDGQLTNIYASETTEVFVINLGKDSEDTVPIKQTTESLSLIEVEEEPSVLVLGDPINGFRYFGPFDTLEETEDITAHYDNSDWWLAPLEQNPEP